MLERKLKENEMHFHFNVNIDGGGKHESVEYFTHHPNRYDRNLKEFAGMLVDLSEEHGNSTAYHIPVGDHDVQVIKGFTPEISVSDGNLHVTGASSPTDYLFNVAEAVQKELLARASSRED